MRIIFTGSGEFGIPVLRSLYEKKHEIVGVYTQPDRPAGRGRKLTPTPIAQFALEKGLPLVRTDHLNEQPLPEADVMVVIAFGQKLSAEAANHPIWGSINLHASRLPALRGAAPINWAILRGDRETGNSVIRLASKMDAGAILGQSKVQIGELETAGELHDRLAMDGPGLIESVLDGLAAGKAIETAQDDSQATQAPKLSRGSAKIDWTQSGEQIARQIRGLYPWPGCRVELQDAAGNRCDSVALVRARSASGEGSRWHPGEIGLHGAVEAGQGAVEIVEIHPEGRRPMSLGDYRRGHSWLPGMQLKAL